MRTYERYQKSNLIKALIIGTLLVAAAYAYTAYAGEIVESSIDRTSITEIGGEIVIADASSPIGIIIDEIVEADIVATIAISRNEILIDPISLENTIRVEGTIGVDASIG